MVNILTEWDIGGEKGGVNANVRVREIGGDRDIG